MRASRLALVLPLVLLAACEDMSGLVDEATSGVAPGSGPQASGEFSETAPFTVAVDPAALTADIEALAVAEERDEGYDRSLFPHWRDDDGNGCDARDDVLIAQDRSGNLTEADCDGAMTGEWVSMYDAETVTDSGDIDIDHFVPLKEAWGSGAVDWTTEDRQAYANWQENAWHLIAVTASSNRSKSDKDPAEWMPEDETVWCAYVWAWVEVKTEWDLSVDEAERAALLDYAARC
ncbi:HNH endonuclease family protein [Glycomyces sp. TRM65418]|uniref:HNH endonuclease family protein n=1 Tax=Glycomyces sp. TRM65418 TaxID=2867006 RepID=UPI001CE630A4|nr:HNH endonuclease family protein [Glycomyces sp. TRM65418]MCC3763266.1 HNH endonuclease family protein [Glycomyces sp. TRM65418]QZD57267.1 HNH endonuclease family protein [Glycomyces sp. TRM65418]